MQDSHHQDPHPLQLDSSVFLYSLVLAPFKREDVLGTPSRLCQFATDVMCEASESHFDSTLKSTGSIHFFVTFNDILKPIFE